jgi:endonuclease/exonuclease/phosphatase family metal-dependent hydrolase
MKQNFLFGWLMISLLFTAPGPGCSVNQKKDIPASLTLMSYNVRNCQGMDGVTDYARVAGIITNTGADVVALQELDSATARSQGIVVLEELADLTGMYSVYGPAIDFQGGKYGIGVLSKEEPVRWETIALPGREEQRAVLLVEFDTYVFGCTHFSLTAEDRLASVPVITEAARKYEKPVFLAGDINDTPTSKVVVSLLENWEIMSNPELFTSRSDSPERCIDYIFALKNDTYSFSVKHAEVGNEPVASDHLPLWSRVEIIQSAQ